MKSLQEISSIARDMEYQLRQLHVSLRELKETVQKIQNATNRQVLTIELDVATPEDVEQGDDFIRRMSKGRPGMKGRLVSNQGPGGGWPVFRFTGPYWQLLEALQEQYDSGISNLDAYVVDGAED
jgi:hypothetical protein